MCLLKQRDQDEALNDVPEPPDPWLLVVELRDRLAAAEVQIARLEGKVEELRDRFTPGWRMDCPF